MTQNYDPSGQGCVDFSYQVLWREPGACCKMGEIPPNLAKKESIFKVYNDDGCCGQRCVAMFFLLQKTRKNMFRYYTVPRRVAQWDQLTRKVCTDIDFDKPMDVVDWQKVTDKYSYPVEIFTWDEERGAQPFYRTQVAKEGMTAREGFAHAAHQTGCISVLLHQLPEGSEYRKHYHLINNVDAATYVRYETEDVFKYCQPCGKRIRSQNFDKH